MKKNLYVPFEISSQVYFTKYGVRAYISNERTHNFYLLEGVSAKLWNFLLKKNQQVINTFILKNDINNDIDSFFKELVSLGLLIDNKSKNISIFNEEIANSNIDKKKYIKFEENMQNWFNKRGILKRLFIELTYNCNLNCIHCYNEKSTNVHKEITFKEIKKTIDEAAELGVFNVVLSGGEATLVKDFYKIAKYIRKKKIIA